MYNSATLKRSMSKITSDKIENKYDSKISLNFAVLEGVYINAKWSGSLEHGVFILSPHTDSNY